MLRGFIHFIYFFYFFVITLFDIDYVRSLTCYFIPNISEKTKRIKVLCVFIFYFILTNSNKNLYVQIKISREKVFFFSFRGKDEKFSVPTRSSKLLGVIDYHLK